jgi:phosphatidylglycerophosphate synthase
MLGEPYRRLSRAKGRDNVTEVRVRSVPRGILAGSAGALALLTLVAAGTGLGAAGWLAGLCALVTINVLLTRALRRRGIVRLALPNRITLTRATLTGAVAALVADGMLRSAHATAVVAIATVALVLDAVDGHVARRTAGVTELGARFDMEVDAFLIFLLSVFVARTTGPWVLAIGAARYAYVIAGWLLPSLRTAVPPRYWRKVVAAIQGIVLAVCAAGLLPAILGDTLVVAALVLLAESFGRDVWWQLRQQHVRTPQRVEARQLALAGTR